jgi:hypothetical protein
VKKFTPPSLTEFLAYFIENGFSKELAERAWRGYDAAEWHDTGCKKVKNWKQKCQNVWFKPENKNGTTKQTSKGNVPTGTGANPTVAF